MTTPKGSHQADTLVIVPTLRERTNLIILEDALRRLPEPIDLLVIDDASDDGTRESIRALMAKGASITLLNRPNRRGLGTAYTLGLAYARRCGYRHIVQMDADLSHDPDMIPKLIGAVRDRDMAIGSRYVPGGGAEGWSRRRWWLSRLANSLVRTVVGRQVRDATGGFRCTRGDFVSNLPLERVVSQGFSWQWEFNRLVLDAGGRVIEVPIRFHERATGKSKLTWRIALEGLIRLFQLHLIDRSRSGRRSATVPSIRHAVPRAAIGES